MWNSSFFRLLVLAVLGWVSACGDDGSSSPPATTEDRAFIFFNRILQAPGRTNFVSVLPDLDASEVDISGAQLELGGFSRVREFEGDLLVFFGESGEIARYTVEADFSLTEQARFSMQSEGVTSFVNSIVFLSPTRAYYIHADQAQVVVWNPSEMTLTGTFPLDLRVEGFPEVILGPPSLLGDRVLVPVAWLDATEVEPRPVVGIAQISATQDELISVVVDSRCGFSLSGFVDGGRYYVVGDWRAGVYRIYSPDPLPPACLLEFDPDTGTFSDSFLDLEAVTNAPALSGVFGLGNGTFAARVYDSPIDVSQIPDDFPNPAEYFGLELWRWGTIDIETGETELVTDLPLSSLSFAPIVIDGQLYIGVAQESLGNSTLFRIDGSSATATVRAAGEILNVLRIR